MENNNDLNIEKLQQKKLIKTVLIAVAICIAIVVIYVLIESFSKLGKVYDYQQQVSEYLQDTYEEEFNIEFLKIGNKKKIFNTGDGAVAYCGHDRNITEYIYKFSPKSNENITCYIAYWYEKETGNSEISEIRDGRQISVPSDEITYYRDYVNNNKTLEIKEALENYLGYEYTIDYNLKYVPNSIYAKSNKKLKNILLDDSDKFTNLCINISKLLEDQISTNITLYYEDYVIRFLLGSRIEFTSYDIHFNNKLFESVNEMISFIKTL